MELELGLKITRATDNDVSSSTDFMVSGDVFGQLWHSRETDSVFILTLRLKGSSYINIIFSLYIYSKFHSHLFF